MPPCNRITYPSSFPSWASQPLKHSKPSHSTDQIGYSMAPNMADDGGQAVVSPSQQPPPEQLPPQPPSSVVAMPPTKAEVRREDAAAQTKKDCAAELVAELLGVRERCEELRRLAKLRGDLTPLQARVMIAAAADDDDDDEEEEEEEEEADDSPPLATGDAMGPLQCLPVVLHRRLRPRQVYNI